MTSPDYSGLGLDAAHELKLRSSAISREVAEARGYRTVRTKRELGELGFARSQQHVPTLLVPVWGVTGEVATRQHRPDVPRERKGKFIKYETPGGSGMVLDVPPGARDQLGNPKVPLWVTEGALKADSAVSAGLCCVAVLGVWNWRGTNSDGGKTALADWESVALNGRLVYVAFDSDAMTKQSVYLALVRLGALLERRGAKVAYIYLPQADSGAKVGLDDYLAGGGSAEGLVQLARPEPMSLDADPSLWPSPHDPMAVARRYMQTRTEDGWPLLRRWRGSWMQWEGPRWVEADDATIRSDLYSVLEHATWEGLDKDGEPTEAPWLPNKHKIANVVEALAAITHLPDKVNPPAWLARGGTRSSRHEAKAVVACANGLLEVATRKLIPHTPAYFNVVAVPFDYDAEASAPLWEEFLSTLWPDDSESASALQEFVGYLVSGRTDIHKILLTIGPSRAGKGTIARIVKRLLGGNENVAGPTLASLGTQFGLQPLIGKPLAIISDARMRGRSDVIIERLLTISGEDTLTVDRKNRDAWTGQLPTRLMILSNELPGFGDASGAIAHRFLILVLTQSWLHKEDKDLTDKLAAELTGILNWALDGLTRLGEKGRFTEPKASEDAVITMLDQASPMSAFVRDYCETGLRFEVSVDAIFGAWKTWCDENGRTRPGDVQAFGRDLRAAVPSIRGSQPRVDGQRYRVYHGVRLSETWECTHGASWGQVSADRVPLRATSDLPQSAEAPAGTPDEALARDGTRETLTQVQLAARNAPPDDLGAEDDFALVAQDADEKGVVGVTALIDLLTRAHQAGLRLTKEDGALQIRGPRVHESLVRELLERKAEVLGAVDVYNGLVPALDWRKFGIAAESRPCVLCRRPTVLLDWDRRACHKGCAEAAIRPGGPVAVRQDGVQ